ncbi:MAG: 30S ribosomal protein S14 [Candidatus Shikimatogenerans sp. Tduv]|uniref:Small ribosomal subunit protein uS14 n=1 Tax=Candidatus Shikimatogenerans sp. Tduv TaxID=3158567 RepID=A0AAU7QR65_9FLAO
MSRKSLLYRLKKNKKIHKKYLNKYKKIKKDKKWLLLQKLPRNSSKVKLKNLCSITGRSRGYIRLFGISRIMFRKLATMGYIPGVKKISW